MRFILLISLYFDLRQGSFPNLIFYDARHPIHRANAPKRFCSCKSGLLYPAAVVIGRQHFNSAGATQDIRVLTDFLGRGLTMGSDGLIGEQKQRLTRERNCVFR